MDEANQDDLIIVSTGRPFSYSSTEIFESAETLPEKGTQVFAFDREFMEWDKYIWDGDCWRDSLRENDLTYSYDIAQIPLWKYIPFISEDLVDKYRLDDPNAWDKEIDYIVSLLKSGMDVSDAKSNLEGDYSKAQIENAIRIYLGGYCHVA